MKNTVIKIFTINCKIKLIRNRFLNMITVEKLKLLTLPTNIKNGCGSQISM